MAKTLPISEVKARLPELVDGVMEREEEVVVTRNGRPAAVRTVAVLAVRHRLTIYDEAVEQVRARSARQE